MSSKARQDIILESQFYSDLTQQLNDNNAFSDQGLFTIDYLNIGVDQTRLFNDEYVKWGVMRMKSSSDSINPSYKKDLEFLFVIDDINLEFDRLKVTENAASSVEEIRNRKSETRL